MYLQSLQQDEIFVSNEMKSLKSLTQMESRRGLENAIISNGKTSMWYRTVMATYRTNCSSRKQRKC